MLSKRLLPAAGVVAFAVAALALGLGISAPVRGAAYPVHSNILTTFFWVGEPAGPDNGGIPNGESAWDTQWLQHFGGPDDPNHRNGYLPAGFTPKENPFYFALPYDDFDDNGYRKSNASQVYWWASKQWGAEESCCKDHWIKITKGSKTAYAQWEDVGPFNEDDLSYVFGSGNPTYGVGLDVSPAVRDYLGLGDESYTNWQFVDTASVPQGPWTQIVTGNEVPSGGSGPTPGPDPGDYSKASYFAEGCTRGGFEEWLCLMNPNPAPAAVRVRYMFTNGATTWQDLTIAATSRATVNVNHAVGADKDVSIKVSSEQQIVAERPMYFNYQNKWNGGHDVVAAAQPLTSFYFAEGCTRSGFDEWISLMNPNSSATTAHLTFMFPDGKTQARDVVVGATSRATVKVNDYVGADKDVSVRVTSDAAIVAERPMYFNYQNKWNGGHDVVGSSQPLTSFYFAEGCTRPGFDEWLCLMNPAASPTVVHLTFMFPDGKTQLQNVALGATTRTTLKVNDIVGAGKDVSVRVTSDAAIVAERPMYFAYQGAWNGGHDVLGSGGTSSLFYFAEGCTRPGFDEWLCLMNPAASPTTAHVTFMFSDGTTKSEDVAMGGSTRATVKVNEMVGTNKDVSMRLTSDAPIVAERPMYFNYKNAWSGGHDVIGYAP
jgi:hypothetical protein